MYLALLLSKDSEQAIRTVLPQCGELHLTVIHAPAGTPPSDNLVENYWRDIIGDRLIEQAEKFAVFGPPTARVLALKLRERRSQGSDLFSLRHVAEESLQRAKIAWSRQWEFSPHITLGKRSAFPLNAVNVDSALSLPKQITFDRLEWRS